MNNEHHKLLYFYFLCSDPFFSTVGTEIVASITLRAAAAAETTNIANVAATVIDDFNFMWRAVRMERLRLLNQPIIEEGEKGEHIPGDQVIAQVASNDADDERQPSYYNPNNCKGWRSLLGINRIGTVSYTHLRAHET